MSRRLATGLILANLLFIFAQTTAADTRDYSKEAVVVQNMTTSVRFAADGAREWRQTLSVRVQSEAAVRQFGVLAFFYSSGTEELTVDYVRVKKKDGTAVETPKSSIQDLATEVATVAPTYSDLRQKQIPVKALGVGDLLEYSIRSLQQKPEIPGQFWYTQSFADSGVVLQQTFELRIPADKYVQVSSRKLQPEIHEESGERVYLWNYARLDPTKPDEKAKTANETEAPKVQLTTFRSWEEVGNWWAALATPEAAVTPAIEQKSKELTAGLTSDAEKERAIYNYVALRFRYISISLGAGKYRPHSAAEVLQNAYGDCKDKHTLFVALLKAAGIPAWPALIGAGLMLDANVPSPAQFNHVVTVIPQNGNYIWLDTTGEVAPFGLLNQSIRDEQALVIPSAYSSPGKPTLVKTPANPPFPVAETVYVKASLASDGTLTGHFDFDLTGDDALPFRSGFRQLAPSQWQAFAQQVSYSLNYAGDVSAVTVENVEDLEKPFHFGYEYTRKNFSDWQEHKISVPLPSLGFGPGEAADKPKESFWAGAPGVTTYHAALELPKGFAIELPKDTSFSYAFAAYSAHYEVKDGTLIAERKITVKQAKVTDDQWTDYQHFSKDLREEQTQLLSLSENGAGHTDPGSENSRVQELLAQAAAAWKRQDTAEVRRLLAQIEQLNANQPTLWAMYGSLERKEGHSEIAISDFRKEIQFHPEEIPAYRALSALLVQAGRQKEAIELWRSALAAKPEDGVAAAQLASLLMAAKQYSEVRAILEKAITAAPQNYGFRVMQTEALLRSGHKEEGIAEAQSIAKAMSRSTDWNDLAYALAETDSALELAQELAQKAVNQVETDCAQSTLDSIQSKDLQAVNTLVAAWDTLGWVHFKQGDMVRAERYMDSAWQLSERTEVAYHLGLIYEKQGKHARALHMWRLAVAVDGKNQDALEQLRKAGEPVPGSVMKSSADARAFDANSRELAALRTIKVPGLLKRSGSAEVFVLLSGQGIEDVQCIGNSNGMQDAMPAIRAAKYNLGFPDSGPEKIVRRGILFCSEHTSPACSVTMLLPSATDTPAAQR